MHLVFETGGLPMRKFTLSLLASTILGMAGQAASAADMLPITKAPPPVVAPYSWSGFYVGGHIGAGWSRNSIADTPGGDPFCTIDGFTLRLDRSGQGFCDGGSHIGLGFIG